MPNGDKKMEWVLVLFVHLLVATGIALIGVGSSAFKSTTPANPSDLTLAEIGMILLLISWVAVVVWAVFKYFARSNSSVMTSRNIGIRVSLNYPFYYKIPSTDRFCSSSTRSFQPFFLPSSV